VTALAATPGLYFALAPPPAEVSPLRSDIAAFIGRTRRGPVGAPVRVEGWRDYLRRFGGLLAESSTTYAVRGYFENEGEVAYVVRLEGARATPAFYDWNVGDVRPDGQWSPDAPSGFGFGKYRIEAGSPGNWGNGTRVLIRYRLRGRSGRPEVDVELQAPGEPPEYLLNLNPLALESEIAARTLLVRAIPSGPAAKPDPARPGPASLQLELELKNGSDDPRVAKEQFLAAIGKLGEDDRTTSSFAPSVEVALVALPGLYEDLDAPEDRQEVLLTLIEQAERFHDRLVLVDAPPEFAAADSPTGEPQQVIGWLSDLRGQEPDKTMRAAALYHPRLWVSDPLGGTARPLRSVPPSGHVAGVISRLDRQRGAHHTPANAPLLEVVDLAGSPPEGAGAVLNAEGVNLLRCSPGRGLQVWGGRTLSRDPSWRFVAHRRLIHRLVRAIRRVAEPLVFENNGPELWLALVRSLTTVLLEAYRAGALQGARPEDAFAVRCDETTTPTEEREQGRVFCEIAVAPAVPMEFILLRIALGSDGKVEVLPA
jgi:uncharacterized protein